MDALTKALIPTLLIDGYKADHRRQYGADIDGVYSNWTPRMSRIEGLDHVTFFGLQYFLDTYLGDQWEAFFAGDADQICSAYEAFMAEYLGPNDIGSDHIRALHRLGYLPLEFRAVPEGSEVPLRVPMLTVENTVPEFFWLVNYFETIMSNVLWMPCTSATIAKRMRRLLDERAIESGQTPADVDFQGHDFSMRGMSGLEAAETSGAAHLISFSGTDTIPAILMVKEHYPTDGLIGASVAATEHSVMCAGGEESELETFERIVDLYPTGIAAIVSDTWNLWDVVTEILPALKDKIMARDGKIVIRPDSGDPADILCGDVWSSDPRASSGVIQLLWEEFGGTVNEAGYKVMDSHIGAIYGDSINYDRADEITRRLMRAGFASTNVTFGMGSYGYQYQTRDTFGFAMKATWVRKAGQGTDIFKKPVTDNGGKNSAKGRIRLDRDEYGELEMTDGVSVEESNGGELRPVWRDGVVLKRFTFDEVRANARA